MPYFYKAPCKAKLNLIVLLLLTVFYTACAKTHYQTADLVLKNAQVWEGDSFSQRDLAVKRGEIIDNFSIAETSTVLDLTNKFIVPAYADAHQHKTPADKKTSDSYLKNGIFYIWNTNAETTEFDDQARQFFSQLETVDVKVALAGITEKGSHPEPFYVNFLGQYYQKTFDDYYQTAFNYGSNKGEIIDSLDRLKKQKTDYVKSYLLKSENYGTIDEEGNLSLTGLNPAHIPFLVQEAKKRDLATFFHIETVHDLNVISAANGDVAAHLPAYSPIRDYDNYTPERIAIDDAIAVQKAGLMVIATYFIAKYWYASDEAKQHNIKPENISKHYRLQAENLRVLQDAKVPILAGTDLPNGSLLNEVLHWVEIGGLTKSEALENLLSTGRLMFPERKIGCFEAGCEADFLVLLSDPSEKLASLSEISLIFKSGIQIK